MLEKQNYYKMKDLSGKKVAILATHGFEKSELAEPKKALEEAGAEVHIVSPEKEDIKSWSEGNWSDAYHVDQQLENVHASDYNALVLPGGVINPDKLRRNHNAVEFTKAFFEQHKPVAAICHGPQMLVESDVLKGRKVTSFNSIKKDLENAGAEWFDEAVVVDHGLVTSRSPEDLRFFNAKLIEEIAEGKHDEQTA